MAVKKEATISRWIGLSTDTKPTSVPPGSTFWEYNTRLMYITHDGTNWVIKDDGDTWLFGDPVLEAGGVGKASWSKSLSVSTNRVAWAAKLDAGKQTGWNDYAKVVIPVNELPFTSLDSVRLEANYGVAVGIDMAVCVFMHDPDNFDEYIELSHTPYTNTGTGYRELNFPTEPGGASWFWYGNVSATPDTCPTEGTTGYTWAQFQGDSVFSTWTIFKITLDYGYYTGDSVMDDCYLCQALINGLIIPLGPKEGTHRKSILASKTIASAGAEGAGDVVSEATNSATDWDFAFGGTGYITKATITSVTAKTPRMVLYLFTAPPDCELDDNDPNTAPLAADIPYFVGSIEFPAMVDYGTGASYAIATPSTVGNLPLMFDAYTLYGVLVTKDIVTFGQTLVTIILGADMEDN